MCTWYVSPNSLFGITSDCTTSLLFPLQEGLLPIGEDSALTPLDPTVVPVSKEMEQSLVGFSQAENIEDCARLPVSGFGLVLAVNLDAKQLHLRVPMLVKELNCTALLLGDIRSYAGHDRA